MYNVPPLFEYYVAQPNREFDVKALVGSTTYDAASVVEFDIEDSVVPSEDFTIGSVITSKLTISIKTSDAIAANAKIIPSIRLNGSNGYTPWVPLSSFYIDSRNFQNNVWKFTCYDKLIVSNQTFVSSLTYPALMQDVFDELIGQLGLTADSSIVISPNYEIPYKDEDITMRDMLGYIASAHGASVRMTKDEKVAFVKFLSSPTRTAISASDYFKVSQTNPVKTYTKIVLTYNIDGETLTVGSGDADHTLNFYNPFMTQAMLNTVFAALNGLSYAPFTMDWKGRPDLEVGDAVTVTLRDNSTFSSVILTNKMSFKGGLKATSTAPSSSAQQSEFNYKGSISQQIAKTVKADTPYYGVTIGRTNGIKVEKSDGSGKLILNSDTIEMDDASGSPVLKLDGVSKKLIISAVIQMLAGSTIDWNTTTPPTADQVGAVSQSDLQTALQSYITSGQLSSALAGYLSSGQFSTLIGQDYIVTGKILANQVAAGIMAGMTFEGAKVADILHVGPATSTGQCHINTATDGMRFQSHAAGNYFKINDAGGMEFYANDTCYAVINPDGSTNLSSSGGGGGAKGVLPVHLVGASSPSVRIGITQLILNAVNFGNLSP